MVSKPTELLVWADQDVIDPVSGQNNVLTPPTEKQQVGWVRQEYPVRQWMNWIGRMSGRWIAYLKQQEEQSIVTNGNGVSLFPYDGALITLTAVDRSNPANYLFAVGYKAASQKPTLNIVVANVLGIDVANATLTGTVPITGGTASNIIAWGQTKLTPS